MEIFLNCVFQHFLDIEHFSTLFRYFTYTLGCYNNFHYYIWVLNQWPCDINIHLYIKLAKTCLTLFSFVCCLWWIFLLSVLSLIVFWGCLGLEDWGHEDMFYLFFACGYTLLSKVSWAFMLVLLDTLDLKMYYPWLLLCKCMLLVIPTFLVSQCKHNLVILNSGNLIALVILTYMSLMPRWDSHIRI